MSDPFASPPPPPVPSSGKTSSLGAGVVPCSNGTRFGATLLDGLLFVVTCGIGWFIWDIVLWSQSTSPAKKMLKLRIVDSTTGAPATMQQMLMRQVLGKYILSSVTSGLTTLIGAILILVQPGRQGIWDYIAKTTVVREG
jgi:uncharacterized RDD family membrane protein YckC